MNPFERKVVHDAIAAIDGVRSESEGEEPNRRVVVLAGSLTAARRRVTRTLRRSDPAPRCRRRACSATRLAGRRAVCADLLAGAGVVRGLLGPREVPGSGTGTCSTAPR